MAFNTRKIKTPGGSGGGGGGDSFHQYAETEAQRRSGNIAQYGNEYGIQRPDFQSRLGPDGSQMRDAFQARLPEQLQFGGVSADPRLQAYFGGISQQGMPQVSSRGIKVDPTAQGQGLRTMMERATAKGPSSWLTAQMGRQGVEQQAALDQSVQQSQSGAAAGRSALAMRGGLTGGAAERMARQGARDLNAGRAQVSRQGMLDRFGLQAQEEDRKLGLLGQAAGMEQGLNLANSDMGMRGQMFNSQQDLGSQQFNAGLEMDRRKFNESGALDASKYNAGSEMQRQQFNAGGAFDAGRQNQGAWMDVQNSNLGRTDQEFNANRLFDMTAFQEQMKTAAAGKSAQAMGGGGKK